MTHINKYSVTAFVLGVIVLGLGALLWQDYQLWGAVGQDHGSIVQIVQFINDAQKAAQTAPAPAPAKP